MDIFEQVDKLLKDMETRENKFHTGRQLVEGSLLVELSTQYNQYIMDRQWEHAHNCLTKISRLVVAILAE